jgi:hypothetical protein
MNEAHAKVVSVHPKRLGAFAVLGLDGVSCSTNSDGDLAELTSFPAILLHLWVVAHTMSIYSDNAPGI